MPPTSFFTDVFDGQRLNPRKLETLLRQLAGTVNALQQIKGAGLVTVDQSLGGIPIVRLGESSADGDETCLEVLVPPLGCDGNGNLIANTVYIRFVGTAGQDPCDSGSGSGSGDSGSGSGG